MKLIIHAIRINPNHIEEIQIEDVANFSVDDTKIDLAFNNGTTESLYLRANDGKAIHEWSGFSLFATRIGLEVDMKK